MGLGDSRVSFRAEHWLLLDTPWLHHVARQRWRQTLSQHVEGGAGGGEKGVRRVLTCAPSRGGDPPGSAPAFQHRLQLLSSWPGPSWEGVGPVAFLAVTQLLLGRCKVLDLSKGHSVIYTL